MNEFEGFNLQEQIKQELMKLSKPGVEESIPKLPSSRKELIQLYEKKTVLYTLDYKLQKVFINGCLMV